MEFIDGVEVLDQTAIYVDTFQWSVFSILFICLIAVCFIGGTIWAIKKDDVSFVLAGFFLSLMFLILLVILGFGEVKTDKYEYKVLINDDVNFSEFNDRYDLIEQEGKIYTIRIKDKN